MSNISLFDYGVLFVSSLIISGALTPLMKKIALRTSFLDVPRTSHKSHSNPVPYLGGMAIMAGVTITIYSALYLEGRSGDFALASGVLVPALILGMVGLIDDKVSLSPFPRFIVQSFAGIFTAWIVIDSNTVGNPTGYIVVDFVLTVFWFIAITNSINFFDNVDGGASGSTAIVSATLFVIALNNGQFLVAGISIVLVGATIGFLIWNMAPARIYMGDAGSLFLGVLISVLTIRLDPQTDLKYLSLAVPIIIMAVPILDTSVAVFSRMRRHVSPFMGGQDHLSHRLLRTGLSKPKAVMVLWALTSIFALSGALISSGLAYSEILFGIVILVWFNLFFFFLKIPDNG